MKKPLALLLLVCISTAHAWGNLGHRITGDIADTLLTPTARKQVQQLLDNESLSTAATYMDEQRDTLQSRWPDSGRWHYDNQPACGDSNYCRDGQCATRQIARFQKVLADRTASRNERALALRLLIHMLGDIHQPLHMADNQDRGGNDIAVRLYAGAERRNLHEVLDTELIRQLLRRDSLDEYVAHLTRQYHQQFSAWSRGTPTQWAQESHKLAALEVYGRLPGFVCGRTDRRTVTLPPDYLQRANAYLPEQLAKAGVRIAAVLNATLQ